MFAQRCDQVVPGQNAGDVASFIHDGKVMLRSGKKRVDRFLKGGGLRERPEFAHHRAGDGETARNISELGERRLLRCAHVNK